ncbi:MAG: hypothetical protein R3C69_06430 [Geminicoccaceae bacterium]
MVGDIMALERTSGQMVEGFEQHTRVLVQVQDGCDHQRTFCVIPFGRGNSRSAPADDVLAQVRKLVAAGYKEVVLTGVDLTSYGRELDGPAAARPAGRPDPGGQAGAAAAASPRSTWPRSTSSSRCSARSRASCRTCI